MSTENPLTHCRRFVAQGQVQTKIVEFTMLKNALLMPKFRIIQIKLNLNSRHQIYGIENKLF